MSQISILQERTNVLDMGEQQKEEAMSQISILQSDQRTPRSRNCRWYRRKLIHGLAVLVLLFGVAFGAEAADEKVFPGSLCVRLGTNNSIYYTGSGGIANPSTTTVTVVCPIVRDSVTANYSSVKVVVQDLNPSTNVACSVHATSQTGFLWHAYPNNPLPPNYSNSQLYTFNIGQLPQAIDRGSYFVTCDLPPVYNGGTSGVFSYRIDEP
jgi:hypothetical protein